MEPELIRGWLTAKYADLQARTLLVLNQLNDEQVNWRPTRESNSIANLMVHMSENIKERIGKGIHHIDSTRNRDQEFAELWMSKADLTDLMNLHFHELTETIKSIPEEKWYQTQLVRNSERTNLDILLQCATHFSEHVGQILFIAKMCLGEEYITTSIPKRG